MTQIRIATFNLENLDETAPTAHPSLAERVKLMKPQISRLRAGIACFQEVHGQEHPGQPRALLALKELLAGTNLDGAALISTKPEYDAVFDMRNLVVATHLPVIKHQHLKNDLVAEPHYQRLTATPPTRSRSRSVSEKSMKNRVHAIAGVLALTLISLFFTASAVVEISGDHHALRAVKTAIVFALFVLVPCMAVTGGTGRLLSARRRRAPLIRRKQRRMAAAAAIGLLVLVPCALALRVFAAERRFDTVFAVVQAVEFLGGAVNITLLSLNVRDGRLLTAAALRRDRHAAPDAAQP